MTDDELRETLSSETWRRLETLGKADPAMGNWNRGLSAFSLTKHGHLLQYHVGPWSAKGVGQIGQGTIQWEPNPDGDQPYNFRIRRDTEDSSKLRINSGPSMTVEEVAEDIVRTFVEQTNP